MADPMNPDEQEPVAMQSEMIEVELEPTEVVDTEDGGAIVKLQDEMDVAVKGEHFANIIDEVDQRELEVVIQDLLDKISRDKDARKRRDEVYEEGLRRTGLGDDAPGGASFTGASKVVHPMLIEACVDFSARMMKEMMPPNGPVRSKIVGAQDPEKLAKAARKSEYMNWQLTEQIPEFRGELEQLSTQLPLGGSQYLKFTWDKRRNRPSCEFIPVDDIYLPFAATNFYTAERKTHVQYITKFEYNRRVEAGMYRDVDLGTPGENDFSAASKANDKIEGRSEMNYNEDGLRTVFEVCAYLDFGDDSGPSPYLLTIDKTTGKGLALYRNWEVDDPMRNELEWVVEFPFIPWRGAYAIGLTHMIGSLSGAATGALRALLDSAHIQNVPTMLKLKGGPNGQTLNLMPTEVVEIEGGVNVDDVRKIAMPIPFNQPSPVLFSLLGFLVDAGKGVVQTTFEKLSDQNPNQPVGTTLALIEQGMVVFSSIHSRLHNSMARVLKVLHRLNSAYLTEELIEMQSGDMQVEPSDFDGPMDVIPVSDPNIFSETQRFAQVQALLQRAAMMPQMYNLRKIEEMFISALKVSDDVLSPKVGEDDRDPVSENVAASMGQPIYVLPKQDHMAHLRVHLAFLQSPVLGNNPAIAPMFMPAILGHLRDHLLNYYLVEAHKGIKNSAADGVLTEDADQEAAFILQVQQIIEQQLGFMPQVMAQVKQMAEQFMQPQMPPDNTMAVAQLRAQVDQMAMQMKAQTDQAKLQLDAQRAQQDAQMEQAKLQLEAQRVQQDAALATMREQSQNARTADEIEARVFMNTSDNETAKQLAAAEIASGEKVSVSTGTGINPQP
jgi:hypothetical protein